jgi:hypothetical protein
MSSLTESRAGLSRAPSIMGSVPAISRLVANIIATSFCSDIVYTEHQGSYEILSVTTLKKISLDGISVMPDV